MGSEHARCACCLPLSQDVPNLSHEKCLRVLALLYLRDCPCTPLTTLADHAIDVSLLDCCPSFDFLFERLEDRLGLPMLEREYRHFVVLLDSERYSMSPAGSSSLKTMLGQHQERNFLSCTEIFSHSWSDVAFDHWPIRVLHSACLMTRRQASSSISTVTKSSRS